ncbi:response regulator [Paraflavisolibacter sp. H34]|uniref:response regulator transcription factor n=1 Tax=Huijunlia imazamoxiresistens TaxID=3127457 RepID=UPI00301A1343
MAWWFKKKKPEDSLSVSGPATSKGEEASRLFEEVLLSLKEHTARLKEKLELLKVEAPRADLADLIASVTADINKIMDLVEHPEQGVPARKDPGASRFTYREQLVPKEETEDRKRADEAPADATGSEALPELAEPAAASKKTVLLVEDNEELLRFYRLALSAHYAILEAANGEEGLRKATEASPDLIVSDLMMPLMDGIELCKAIKGDINTDHIPFIILTAKDAVASRLEGVQSGADAYLAKPTSAELLHATIENIFLQRQKIKEYFSKKHYSEALTLVNSVKEQEFLTRFIGIIDQHLAQEDLGVDLVCRELGLSRSRLYLKIRDLTGQSTVEFVRSYRLKKAREIMTHEDVSLTEVIARVGIQTPSYFTKAFKKEFGQTPSQFLEELKKLR